MTTAKNDPKAAASRVRPGAILRALASRDKTVLPQLDQEPACADEPQLTILRRGPRVQRIIAVCTCGKKIEIECDYPGD